MMKTIKHWLHCLWFNITFDRTQTYTESDVGQEQKLWR